ncbi:hypothetical protein BC830DRAFT_1078681 [Chytriomyces sp. MP71]|nr:hypothetical protein BC830DRAFT_1078681 [Chytriomyces sp. MP71]
MSDALDAFLDTALAARKPNHAAARLGGPLIKRAFFDRTLQGALVTKSNTSDLVTATDKAVEALVKAHILSVFPDHGFVGEETFDALAPSASTQEYVWVIDPVDGTTNFVHGFPFTCISIGLVKDGVSIVGVVLNPILNETYYAAKGTGAFLLDPEGVRHVLPLHGLKPWAGFEGSLVSTEYGYERDERLDSKLTSLTRILKAPTRGIRSLGSAALEACYTARGTFDLYWEAGVHMWDVAASAVIIEEAGGAIANFVPFSQNPDGSEFVDLKQRKFIFVRPIPGGREEAWKVVRQLRDHLETLEYQRD